MLNIIKVPKLEVKICRLTSALVAKVAARLFPCIVCVDHLHISDQILVQTCMNVFLMMTFEVKNERKKSDITTVLFFFSWFIHIASREARSQL